MVIKDSYFTSQEETDGQDTKHELELFSQDSGDGLFLLTLFYVHTHEKC